MRFVRLFFKLIVLPSFFILGLIPGEKDSTLISSGVHQNQLPWLDQIGEIFKRNIKVRWFDVFIWGIFSSNMYAASFLGPQTVFQCTTKQDDKCGGDIKWLISYGLIVTITALILISRNTKFTSLRRFENMLNILVGILFTTTIVGIIIEYSK